MDQVYLSRHVLSWMVVGALLLAPGAGPTRAQADGADGSLMHACVGPAGQMRLVAADATCLRSEQAVQWRSAPEVSASAYGPARIVDSAGHDVGLVLGPGVVGIDVGDFWLALGILRTGFVQTQLQLWYPSSNCTGDAYVFASPGQLFRFPFVFGSFAYYAADDVMTRTFGSAKSFNAAQPQGACSGGFSIPLTAGPAATLDLQSLGTPPFGVAQ